ncbi:vacuolar membrane protein [Coccidioides immitis RMSCC 2394]|uniref:Vacuolar membrane protein n=1 Tax=Coccidioides immitis RMSCC 2394 TaxID=404692 RepID=A0A0J6YNY6_COCIT|nr:vacuolar membrane protein [Coccidioides immitis RMSCC 2394]
MPSPWVQYPSTAAIPEHCEPATPFLATVSSFLHICLPTHLALLSSTLGTLSIVSWLFAQLPQIYKNYSLQSTAGLSVWFLVEWCLGDSGNLIGSVLTNQAGWQIIIASYYVMVDIVLVFQYYWYTYLKGWRFPRYGYISAPEDDDEEESWEGVLSLETNSRCQLASTPTVPRLEGKTVATQTVRSLDTPQSHTPSNQSEKRIIAGRIASWTSTIMYLASRLPQIFKNYRRKSTTGLSPLLFFAAFCGNFFYSTSLLTNPNAWFDFPPYGGGGWAGPDGSDRLEWIGRAIPFWLGAAGVLVLDFTVGLQFMMYAEKDEELVIKIREEAEGRSRWKKVTGWMRGWIPSGSAERDNEALRAAMAVENRALLASRGSDSYGGV